MKWICGVALGFGLASGAVAQSTPAVVLSAPVDGFCYYGGLAYSQNALLTVEVPNRRQDPTALQKRLARCVAVESGKMSWEDYDLEKAGLSK